MSFRLACLPAHLVGGCLFLLFCTPPAFATEKAGMPDLVDDESGCQAVATANAIVWFGRHGYPKLLQSGDTEDEENRHTVHRILAALNGGADNHTILSQEDVGIAKYIHEAGYDGEVEYRGLLSDDSHAAVKVPFTQDWLRENDDPNKCFVLSYSYYRYNPSGDAYTEAVDYTNYVTLVNFEPEYLLINDPYRKRDSMGRQVLSYQILTHGTWLRNGEIVPVSGFLQLSGSMLNSPQNSGVMLTGAVRITMHPAMPGMTTSSPDGGTNGATASPSTPAGSSAPASNGSSWVKWLFDLFFKK